MRPTSPLWFIAGIVCCVVCVSACCWSSVYLMGVSTKVIEVLQAGKGKPYQTVIDKLKQIDALQGDGRIIVYRIGTKQKLTTDESSIYLGVDGQNIVQKYSFADDTITSIQHDGIVASVSMARS